MDESTRRPLNRAAVLRENRAILTMAVLLCVFLVLTALARTELLLGWDRKVTLGIQTQRNSVLDAVAVGISLMGTAPTLAIAALVCSLLCAVTRRPAAAIWSALTLLSFPLNMVLKEVVGRPRPSGGVSVVAAVTGLSFPSGHSMTSAAVLGFLAFLAWIHVSYRGLRVFTSVGLVTLAVLIGLTRIYLGAHWLSDVVAGWTAGLCFALLFAEIYKARAQREVIRRAG